ncbi:leucyl aminopeptidase [Yoonia sediminilitoris]|uniref:Probable cytosol aminopeptidase n=1 Tax=Yoonia sediminilitoris TaxID=1286148 RepID=A0A2T6KCR9_9RHOB|nr:leucyl aminopeptidase [Yoonia sediminilitoris]PUB12759.1 leucyl aminopeptidase [Yoonia sediminilitoris]RCW94238.1 leucyl aminopeptidase [Yoonia sediminilitoris]
MTTPIEIHFKDVDLDAVETATGKIAVVVGQDGKFDMGARRVNKLSRKMLDRFVESESFEKMAQGDVRALSYPAGLAASAILVVKLDRKRVPDAARKAGTQLAKAQGTDNLLILAGAVRAPEEMALGLALRNYRFDAHKTGEKKAPGSATFMVSKPEEVAKAAAPMAAIAEGVFFTRDLTNEPANVLTTDDFAARLAAMRELGLEVEILEEDDLEKLGMRTLLSVGQGSDSPSKVAVMSWKGGGEEAPFALVGKGVVFDTGGISLKQAAGMETMTMDMGGAGVVAGVMRTLALRNAKANVVGLVGLVENMPSGSATRPGDVIKSMKGDTVEIINTDAEGRLVLADVLWYTQERFKPTGIINLATLTGAIIVSLGHENAGVFSNSDELSDDFLKAAKTEGEGAWRLPLAPAYDDLIKSKVADIKNSAGRNAGSITAAQFLKRFVKDDVPWCHLDIAGVASISKESAYAPAGATGWGVMALNRLIADKYEG